MATKEEIIRAVNYGLNRDSISITPKGSVGIGDFKPSPELTREELIEKAREHYRNSHHEVYDRPPHEDYFNALYEMMVDFYLQMKEGKSE